MPKKELSRRLRDTRRTQCMDLLVWKNSAYNIMSFEEATSNYIGFNYQEFIFIRLILTQSFQKTYSKHQCNKDKFARSTNIAQYYFYVWKGCGYWTRILKNKKNKGKQGLPGREEIWEENLGQVQGTFFWNRCYTNVISWSCSIIS